MRIIAVSNQHDMDVHIPEPRQDILPLRGHHGGTRWYGQTAHASHAGNAGARNEHDTVGDRRTAMPID